MRHSYSLSFARQCPVDGNTIRYELKLWSHGKVLVEDIQSACIGDHEPIFQEDLAKLLFETFVFASGRLSATHDTVLIVSEWGPE